MEEYFNTKTESTQVGGISGINVNFCFEKAVKEIRHTQQTFKLAQNFSENSIDEKHPSDSVNANFIDTEP